MKILQVTPYFLPHTGGIERYVYNLSKYLISEGHNVDVLTSLLPLELPTDDIIDDIRVYRYPSLFEPVGNPIITRLQKLPDFLSTYDVIHMHALYPYSSLRISFSIDKTLKQKIILTHHGRFFYSNPIKNLFPKIYEKLCGKYILNKVDKVVVLSKSDKKQIMSLGANAQNISIIPNGIDTSIFSPPSIDAIELFKESHHLLNKKIVLYLAVVSKRKGIIDLIYAFSQLTLKDVQLVVVGDGAALETVIDLVHELNLDERVLFTGKLPFLELLVAYAIADVYVLPSYHEGMPTTIIEALVMGVPVIATRIPGVEDNFSEYATLVEPGNPAELARAIEHVLNNGDTRCKLGASEIAMFDSKHAFEMYSTLYQ